jgi:hypothetical protein
MGELHCETINGVAYVFAPGGLVLTDEHLDVVDEANLITDLTRRAYTTTDPADRALMDALQRDGLLDSNWQITDLGREALTMAGWCP